MSGKERWVQGQNSSVRLWTESFGNPGNPALLLLPGAGLQGITWPRFFCEQFADEGFFVIRFDSRDTGLSSRIHFETDPYSLDDMVEDAREILDEYTIDKAHLVGFSMGGIISQLFALIHPNRVSTLSLLMTTADHAVYIAACLNQDTSKYALPPPCQEYIAYMQQDRRFETKQEYLERELAQWKVNNGKKVPFPRAWIRGILEKAYDRVIERDQGINHGFACTKTSGPIDRLNAIQAPTLIIHGDCDPIIPSAHGEAIHAHIRNSQFHLMKGLGHCLFPAFIPQIHDLIRDFIHTNSPQKLPV